MTKITSGEYLHALATHFSPRDWEYTRIHTIKHIRYDDDNKGYNRLDKRIRRAVGALFEPKHGFFHGKGWDWRFRFAYARVQLRLDANLPDGVLNGGSIISHWEEDGEYLQMVQPSVGELLAEFLCAEPDNPHAVKIIAELDRLRAGYAERAKEGEVDGVKR